MPKTQAVRPPRNDPNQEAAALKSVLENAIEVVLRKGSAIDEKLLLRFLIPHRRTDGSGQATDRRALCRADLGDGSSRYYTVTVASCEDAFSGNTDLGNTEVCSRGGNVESCD